MTLFFLKCHLISLSTHFMTQKQNFLALDGMKKMNAIKTKEEIKIIMTMYLVQAFVSHKNSELN